MKTKKLFLKSKYFSNKHKRYFDAYDELFFKFKNKKIVFVEIGVQNGGSLFIWKKYFKNAKIIGIDLNPKCKIFEKYGFKIEIGDQTSSEFWKSFFKKYGKVDIILDDGGHTNDQQVITAVSTIPKIKNGGMLLTEDTFCSYMKDFGNPYNYSFINFAKKTIDDINYKFPGLGKHNFSLNDYVYSMVFFNGMAVFKVNRKLCYKNNIITNKKRNLQHKDYRYNFDYNTIIKKTFLFNFKIFRKLNEIIAQYKMNFYNKYRSFKSRKYFY